MRIARIDAVDAVLGGKKRLRSKLDSTLDRRIVCSDVRIPSAGRDQDNVLMVQMSNRAQTNKWFRDRVDRDRRHHPNLHVAASLEYPTQQEAVGHGGHHPDVIGFGALDAPLLA